MGWLIALGILLLIGMIPLGASVNYDAEGPLVRLIAGPVRLQVYPTKKKPDQKKKTDDPKKKTENTKQKAAPKPKESKQPKPDNGGSWQDFLPLVEVGLDALGDLRRKLRVNHLKLHLTMAGDDPCDLAVNYGRLNAALAALLARLDALFVIKRQDVHINCDFVADQTTVTARLDLTLTVGRLLSLALRHGLRALTTYSKIKKHQEGGANL